jgi:polar amino acid transport system substrate-binding protein
MSLSRHRSSRAALLVAPLAAVVVVALAGCSTGASTTPAASDSKADPALVKLLPASIKKAGVISFGALWETPPGISVDPSNTKVPIGITPDLAAAMAPLLGVTAKWENMQWPAQLPGLQSGNIDVLFGQVSDSVEREQSVVDLIPYSKSTQSMLVPIDNPKSIDSLASTCGMTIGAPTGSTMTAELEAASKICTTAGNAAIKTASYPGASAAISALRAGNIDGWLDSTSTQKAVVANAPTVFDQVVIPDSETIAFDSGYGGIAISKSNPGLSKAIAGALKELIDNGEYAKIMKKWKSEDISVPAGDVVVNLLTKTPAGEKAAS